MKRAPFTPHGNANPDGSGLLGCGWRFPLTLPALLADALEDVTPPNTTISACSAGSAAGGWMRSATPAIRHVPAICSLPCRTDTHILVRLARGDGFLSRAQKCPLEAGKSWHKSRRRQAKFTGPWIPCVVPGAPAGWRPMRQGCRGCRRVRAVAAGCVPAAAVPP